MMQQMLLGHGGGSISFSASLLSNIATQSGGNQALAAPKVAQTSDGGVILASNNRNSIYRSTNNGQSWSLTYDGTETSYNYGQGNIFINDAGTHAIAAPKGSNFGKIIYSSNGGQSWTTKVTTNDAIYAGTYDQTTGIVMMGDRGAGGSSSSDLNRSSDHGQSWSVAIDSDQSDHVNVGMAKGSAGNAISWSNSKYYTSTNGGSSWTQATTPTNHTYTSVPYVVFNSSGKFFYKGSGNQQIASGTSLTGARTITTISGMSGTIYVIQIDDDGIIYVGSSSGEIYFSKNNGSTYEELTAWSDYYTSGNLISDLSTQNSSGRFLVATREGSGVNSIHVLQKS